MKNTKMKLKEGEKERKREGRRKKKRDKKEEEEKEGGKGGGEQTHKPRRNEAAEEMDVSRVVPHGRCERLQVSFLEGGKTNAKTPNL